MDFEKGLIAAILREGFETYAEAPLPEDALSSRHRTVLRAIEKYYLESGKTYDFQTIEFLAEMSFQDAPKEPISYWKSEIKDRYLFSCVKNVCQQALDLNAKSPVKAINLMQELLRDLEDNIPATAKLVSIFDEAIWERAIADIESGNFGIPTPWPSINERMGGLKPQDLVILAARPGVGKCHDRRTKILMHDGSIKEAQFIVVDDLLMGPDSKPRRVLSICQGREEMFEVVPVKGEPWKCNRSHILSLKISSTFSKTHSKGDIINLSVDDYLSRSAKFKHQAKLYRTGVDWPDRPTEMDPYDNCTQIMSGITTSKEGVSDYVHAESERLGLCANRIQDQRIPKEYLVNCRTKRLATLAGFLDRDGLQTGGGFEIITKHEGLRDDLLFLARSLGLAATASLKITTIKSIGFTGEYQKVFIFGDLSEVPFRHHVLRPRMQVKDPLVTGFSLKSLGEGDYCGFSLDGDHLYCLADFTVTHNTFAWLITLIHAWKLGHKVLAVTTEMSMESMILRATATATKTSYGRTRKGRLLSYEKNFIRDTLRESKESGAADRFMMMGDSFEVYIESIESKIQSFKPDIVAIDGAYLMKSRAVSEKDRFNRIAEMFNLFKGVAKRHNIPMLITTQLNRGPQGGAKQKRGLDRLAFSDNVGMIADGIFFLNQEEEDRERKQMIIEIGKIREGDDRSDIVVNWDFENQNFSEVSAEELDLQGKAQTHIKTKWSSVRAPKEKVIDE